MISCKDYVAQEKEKIKELTKDNEHALHIFQVGDNPASNSYIKGKLKDCEDTGIKAYLHKYPESITTDELIEEYDDYCYMEDCGTIFQLPMPDHIDLGGVIAALDIYQDVDGFKEGSRYTPCTPAGIIDWLEANNIDLTGKNVCIIGRSDIVGKPLARLMLNKNATVTLCHSKTQNLEEHMKIADIIVVAVGKPKFIHDVDLPKRPIIVDVGINRVDGKLCGDVDYENMKDTCSYITSVPGGVGLLTRLALLKNIIKTKN